MAERFFLQALEQEPQNSTLIRLTARAAAELGHTSQAEKLWTENIKNIPEAYLGLAMIRIEQKKYIEATNFLLDYLQQKPKDAYARFLLGTIQFRVEQFDAAYKNTLKAGGQDNTLKQAAFVMAAEAKFRKGDSVIARKALKKAKTLQGFSLVEERVDPFLALLDRLENPEKPWWVSLYLDVLYNDNKLRLSQNTLTKYIGKYAGLFKTRTGAKQLNNSGVVQGFEAYAKGAIRYDILKEPMLLSSGYGLTQQFLGFAKGDVATAYGTKSELKAPATARHTLWLDGSKYFALKKLSLEPGLEIAATADLPNYSAGSVYLQAIPRLSIFADTKRSLTLFSSVATLLNQFSKPQSYRDIGFGLQGQVTHNNPWSYTRLEFAFGNRPYNDQALSLIWRRFGLDIKQTLGKSFYFDLRANAEQQQFENRPDDRIDNILGGRVSLGYSLDNRKFYIGPMYEANYVLSSIPNAGIEQNLYGIRLGGAF